MPHCQRISKGHPKQETARDPRFIARAASQRSQWDGSHLEIHLVVGFLDCGLGGLWVGWEQWLFFSFQKQTAKKNEAHQFHGFTMMEFQCSSRTLVFWHFLTTSSALFFLGGSSKFKQKFLPRVQVVCVPFWRVSNPVGAFAPISSHFSHIYSAEMTDQMSKIWYNPSPDTVNIHEHPINYSVSRVSPSWSLRTFANFAAEGTERVSHAETSSEFHVAAALCRWGSLRCYGTLRGLQGAM